MSRRTDVLNKYPAPRVSAVNQSCPPVRPSAGFSQSPYDDDDDDDARTRIHISPVHGSCSSGVNQSVDKGPARGGNFYDRPEVIGGGVVI